MNVSLILELLDKIVVLPVLFRLVPGQVRLSIVFIKKW